MNEYKHNYKWVITKIESARVSARLIAMLARPYMSV